MQAHTHTESQKICSSNATPEAPHEIAACGRNFRQPERGQPNIIYILYNVIHPERKHFLIKLKGHLKIATQLRLTSP